MSVEIKTEAVILNESIQFMKLGEVTHLATVPVITLSNARELTEYALLRQASARMYMDDPKDYIHEYAVIKDSNNLAAIISLGDKHNSRQYMNKEVIDFKQIKYSNASTGLQGYNFNNITYDYQSYQPQHRNVNSNIKLVSLELEGFRKVNYFAQLDAHVLVHLNNSSQTSNPINLVFLLTFSNGKTYRIPYTLTSADMQHFSSYKLLRSYCDLMKNCTLLFTERIETEMNQVQLDALEMAGFNW
ncbi:hypothetical protein M670_04523 [Schinkia azotoformans MEV2011]|uniref:Uncharacterized protein n=1 Tax=Schinkia azotoformans MEV2011 TaxID=1348973 RepID=A0A072NFG5_SCHAZ|nr:hypothetical protein [Schinkia azotoformans]KEF36286.1 hypothetical protein M670_04523 [Schinkia azotoformans MEV2011]MEC1697870.1 hypothetical protein [Schinkia azotoformans]MEC1723149.1 hypothetical protein [Schinkia azotoformans]MEC1771877.1 hypothetical protein [Schinkia azotoformans]MEC1780271.1 hypothetical protein [Schinkia azotoformans]